MVHVQEDFRQVAKKKEIAVSIDAVAVKIVQDTELL